MSKFEVAMCTNAPWRWFARRVVLPWGLHGFVPDGDVLEIGCGSGAMAAELLERYPEITMTATDFDDVMVANATTRLAPFGDRVTVRQADATALPFPDASFDVVVTWLMLHHTVEWERAIAEAVRVLRPGGHVVGYDLATHVAGRALHRSGQTHRMMKVSELRSVAGELPLADATVAPALGGFFLRFALQK